MKKMKLPKIIILITITLTLIITLIISLINIFNWNKDNTNTEAQTEELQNNTNIETVQDTENTEIIKTDEIKKEDPYWDFIKMNLINVDFSELKKENSDTVGWIQVGGTNINYPFVQTKNNNYYLNHSFDKSYNDAGWVFLDYRNDKNLADKNNIIYAHSRLDKTMFGSLKNILTNGWLKNKDNYIIKISSESENTLWQIFSTYIIPTTNDYLQTEFSNDNEFKEYANMLLERSNHNFNTIITNEDKILTLSTCKNNDRKIVLHAKLIKREKK